MGTCDKCDELTPTLLLTYWHHSFFTAEHVLEGQLIGDFFKQWLPNGQVNKQPVSMTLAPANTIMCSWTKKYVQSVSGGYKQKITGLAKADQPLIHVLLSKLGCISHLDRLTILMARPNGMKGRLFSGNRAIIPDAGSSYRSMTPEAPLLAVKGLGKSLFIFDIHVPLNPADKM